MTTRDPFRHVILLMLENRAFDQMLGDLKHLNPDIDGIDRAAPNTNADPKTGTPMAQRGGAQYSLPAKVDIGHEPEDVDAQVGVEPPAAAMSGFVADFRNNNASGDDDKLTAEVMAYYATGDGESPDALPVLHGLAKSFLVCDRWFSSLPGPTWPNRLFALTGTSAGWRHMPSASHPTVAPFVYDQDTIFDRFADKGLTARTYCDSMSMTWILSKMWLHPSRRRDLSDFDKDVAGPEVNFPAFALIEPDYFGDTPSDQHPPHDVRRGEALIARVYKQLRANKALWESTLLVVTYDEHGGFYDHVSPTATIAPDDAAQDGFDFTRLGVRVPAVLVSPWLAPGACHTQFDHTSLLRYLADKWDLVSLGRRAAGANSIAQAVQNLLDIPRSDAPEAFSADPAGAPVTAPPNAHQWALAQSARVMASALGLDASSAATRALAQPADDITTLRERTLSCLQDAEATASIREQAHSIKVLAVHGVGHGDKNVGWQDGWQKAILDQVRAQPGAGDWDIEVEFAHYDDIFEQYPLSAGDIANALLTMAGGLISGPNESPQRDLLGSLSNVSDDLRWTAGMTVQWVGTPALRDALKARLLEHIQAFKPDLVAAHSLGSLIAYDTLRQEVAKGTSEYDSLYVLTFASQLAHPAVLPVFDGRLEPLRQDGHGAARWFDLFNAHDLVFTRPLPFADAWTQTLETDFNGLTNGTHDVLSHDGASYLSHPGSNPAWSALTAKGVDVAKSLGAPSNAPSIADSAPVVLRTKPSRQRALLVGINAYPDPKNRLEGCVNDVFLISSVLQESGFAPEDIRLLLDERATRTGMEERLEWLMDGVADGDTRVFYYSGHGTQIPTYGDHATPEGSEESLVPYDFDWSEAHAFTDSTFRKFYAQLPYGVNFLAGFDCCHAGGMSRGTVRPRGIDPPDDVRHRALRWSAPDQMWVPRDWVPASPRPNKLFVGPGQTAKGASHAQLLGQSQAIRSIDDHKVVRARFGHQGPYLPLMMFACGETELASEYEHGSISYGAFSFVFAKTLRDQAKKRKAPDLKQVVAATTRELKRLGYHQTPELVGSQRKYGSAVTLRTVLGQ